MAELRAQESPDRVYELEAWGALFDRTKDGKISHRNSGGRTDPDDNRHPPELLPRDEVARENNAEVKAGCASPHGGVFLDIASRLPTEEILRRLPSPRHPFCELAGVDITTEPMEVGPAQHSVMGGVEVDPDTGAAPGVPGLFAADEVSGGMHGSNRLGGNSLSDLLVFGRRAGADTAEYLAPLNPDGGENPYTEVKETMSSPAGINRTEAEIKTATSTP